MSGGNSKTYILGLDIGANSIGWAIVNADSKGNPTGIRHTGVRIFEAGVANYDTGKEEESWNKKRREMRLARRRLDRHVRRLNLLFSMLQNHGLLLGGNEADGTLIPPKPRSRKSAVEKQWRDQKAKARDKIISDLDKKLIEQWEKKLKENGVSESEIALIPKKFPYLLRAKALDEKLELYEIGRAIYHIAQRRGFRSNRKAPLKEDEKKSKTEQKKEDFERELKEVGARTLGEYFYKRDPTEKRIRGPKTFRELYKAEFNQIWTTQEKNYPDILTEELKTKLFNDVIFFQRLPWFDEKTIGKCEFEKGEKRAHTAILDFQRFRMLQKVNDLLIYDPYMKPTKLTDEQRKKLIDALEIHGDIDFERKKGKKGKKYENERPNVRDIIDIPDEYTLNLENASDKALIGNRTAAHLANIFGIERWKNLSEAEKEQIVEHALSDKSNEDLKEIGKTNWKLDEEQATDFGNLELEQGYCNLSKMALGKILPRLINGEHYSSIVSDIYPKKPSDPLDTLPPLFYAVPEIRNPVVNRSLTELRKVINAIVGENGKPQLVRIELTRQVKKTSKQRLTILRNNSHNRTASEKAKEEIVRVAGVQKPRSDDIEKYKLLVECEGLCPYCGNKKETVRQLFSGNSSFDVDHIVPRSKVWDNSYVNKILCCNDCNKEKGSRTPAEAFESNKARWSEIIQRVKKFKGVTRTYYDKKKKQWGKNEDDKNLANEKLRRFRLKDDELKEFLEEFQNKQLNDTAYASRLAMKYVGLLFGTEASKRIQVSNGSFTSKLCSDWGLYGILNDGGRKDRNDHRHHAVDAVAIALTDKSKVDTLTRKMRLTVE